MPKVYPVRVDYKDLTHYTCEGLAIDLQTVMVFMCRPAHHVMMEHLRSYNTVTCLRCHNARR